MRKIIKFSIFNSPKFSYPSTHWVKKIYKNFLHLNIRLIRNFSANCRILRCFCLIIFIRRIRLFATKALIQIFFMFNINFDFNKIFIKLPFFFLQCPSFFLLGFKSFSGNQRKLASLHFQFLATQMTREVNQIPSVDLNVRFYHFFIKNLNFLWLLYFLNF